MHSRDRALQYHQEHQGKIQVMSKVPVKTQEDLSLAYTPGVAEPCRAIQQNPGLVDVYTNRANMVAIVTDGTAVLGLGDIGPMAGLPVMEGKSILFKMFGGVDAVPICLDTKDPDKIVETVRLLQPSFGGVNLEDVSAPRAFEIEQKLKDVLSIPVFNDDQHGTAVVVGAAVINALKYVGKALSDVRIVFNGAGAAAIATAKHLLALGARDVSLVDRQGLIYDGRPGNSNPYKEEIAQITNLERRMGGLAEALEDADVFIGVSVAGALTLDMVRKMKSDAIVFALANPVPEIWPVLALEAGARVVGTGRSDFPNQINNVLGFPGIFRGALDVRARDINEAMRVAASVALANLVRDDELRDDYIIPQAMDRRVAPAVAKAVAQAALNTGVAQSTDVDPNWVEKHCRELVSQVLGQEDKILEGDERR
ncbi:malate dehydrogenase (oxaloacetate-decarboxylating) [Sulfobacillus thermosulfidooxidans DSM 9293]|uniref:Malate dehydrogenase (Oxaloacetate-decarboxylating) n=2 Tax=Sulfobacillus thermosulfidooxidans TaxID=28034 RepID=A0A1W1W5X2_SULTA|nr:NADP-dependent malic enzyme [Sulfobacillus thermosulfidooxidans]PSR24276.1 MAG: NADP-dependent malic enzyme [Sulfobacillus thermosulfidooxidans]SMC01697.1 malate dehydrogenase (oxaloacetate-decarboxylating) [Sulfobacillus thermosulfidooxidans DSM 9293]